MSLKVKAVPLFGEWMLGLDKSVASLIIKAFVRTVNSKNRGTDIGLPGVIVSKLPFESPTVLKLSVITVTPNICVLFGLMGDYVIIGAWGTSIEVANRMSVQSVHIAIEKFKGEQNV